MATNDDRLAQIDSKLSALLALYVDSYLRQTGIAKTKDRSIDQILADAGLSSAQIAGLLGKTQRAVNLQLEAKAKKSSRGTKS
jgi:hypothetical protein